MAEKMKRSWWPDGWPKWPNNPKARKAVANLYELGMYILEAPASRRKERAENLEQRAAAFFGNLGRGEQNKVALLVELWRKNAFFTELIKRKRRIEGLEAVKALRPKWYTAKWKMEKAEETAESMGFEAYDYFKSKQDEFFLIQEERDENGNLQDFPDYSELRRQWYAREAITEPLPWAWEKMIDVCLQFPPEKSTINWQFWSFLVGLSMLGAYIVVEVFKFIKGS